jgi:DNA-binding NtrC family response regulator
MIHSSSKRRAKPYTFIDCASLPEVLIEQELFGVESKSEQGGAEPKVGLLEMSDGGTLHINEVEKLPPNVQSKLLRFLEEGRLSRVNSQETQKLDVRIIVANSKPLLESAENRSFHKELYYRLNVIIIDIPPLRERIEDIPVLAEYYLEKFNKINEIQKKLNARVIDALCQYPFPGNLRELSNLIEQMAVLSSSKQIEVGDLPTHIQPENSFLKTEGKEKYGNLPQAVERLEKKMIVDAFKLYSNQVKVALHLNINQSTLSRKLKKYKLKGVIQG